MVHRDGNGDDPTRLGAVRPTGASKPLEPTTGAQSVEPSAGAQIELEGPAAVAQALEAGEITPAEARNQLVESALQARLPDDVNPALRAEIRAEIEAVLDADPTLARLLDPAAS